MAKYTKPAEKKDIYQEVTNNILKAMESGDRDWIKPWVTSLPQRFNGKPYNGINVLLLWASSVANGFKGNRWITYNQAKVLGGTVKKGSKATMVVFYKTLVKEITTDAGEKEESFIPLLRYYNVFNVDQVEGLPERYYLQPAILNETERNEKCDLFFKTVGADVRHGGMSAFYRPSADFIQLPDFGSFKNANAYYATSAHEHVHWTNHKDRLNRSFGDYHTDATARAQEELVAEIGSAFVCAKLGLEPMIDESHAPYIKGWIEALKNDKKYIFKAAKHAQKAVEYLSEKGGLIEEEAEEETEELAA